jgi:N utilization substance protein B
VSSVKSRRHAREVALRVLYELEHNRRNVNDVLQEAFAIVPQATDTGVEASVLAEDEENYWENLEFGFTRELETYAEQLVRGVLNRKVVINDLLQRHLKDYALDRLSSVDRVVMQIATYELLDVAYLSPNLIINEAIEIAKKFSSAESSKFVNGVLGQLYLRTPKANWDPKEALEEPEVYRPIRTAPIVPEEIVEADSEDGKKVLRFGWVLKSELTPE